MQSKEWSILWEQSSSREDIDIEDSVLTQGLDGIVNTMKLQKVTEQNPNCISVMPICVSGMNFILPKERVYCVMDWDESEQTVDEANVLLGVCNFKGKKLLVFDTAIMVIPRGHPKRSRYLAQRRYKKLVVFDSGKWGLVCERVDDAVIFKRADVVWRKSFKKHGWLAGMLPEYGYSLIDVDRFYAMARRYPL